MGKSLRRKSSVIRNDSLGGGSHHGGGHHSKTENFDSLTYIDDESDVYKSAAATEHYLHRGIFWNSGKHKTLICYLLIAAVGIVQATVAYLTNLTSTYFISVRSPTDRMVSSDTAALFENAISLDAIQSSHTL